MEHAGTALKSDSAATQAARSASSVVAMLDSEMSAENGRTFWNDVQMSHPESKFFAEASLHNQDVNRAAAPALSSVGKPTMKLLAPCAIPTAVQSGSTNPDDVDELFATIRAPTTLGLRDGLTSTLSTFGGTMSSSEVAQPRMELPTLGGLAFDDKENSPQALRRRR